MVGESYQLSLQCKELVHNCIQEIGFLLNEKSDWAQFPSILGSTLGLVRVMAQPSEDQGPVARRLLKDLHFLKFFLATGPGRPANTASSEGGKLHNLYWRSLFRLLASMIHPVP